MESRAGVIMQNNVNNVGGFLNSVNSVFIIVDSVDKIELVFYIMQIVFFNSAISALKNINHVLIV